MIVDYISSTLSCVRWNSNESSVKSIEGNYIVGCTHWETENELKIFTVSKTDDGNLEFIDNPSKKLDSSIRKLSTFGKSNVICAKENGNATLYTIDQTSLDYEIKEIKNWNNLSQLALTDIIVDLSKKSLVFSSEDGHLYFIDINSTNYKVTKSKEISKSPIKCIQLLNSTDYIFGNDIGCLKIYDIRKGEINMDYNLVQNLSSINCISKHKGNNYIVACGNDQGLLRIIDLRNTTKDLQLIAAHDAPITELKYKSTEPNSIITSSLDGELLSWSFSVDTSSIDVHSIFGNGTKQGSSILSFDLNSNDMLAFSTDLESIYCTEL